MASMPAVSFTRPGGIWKMSVPPAASSTSARSRKRANAWQSFAVAEDAVAGGRRNLACDAAHVPALAPKREVRRQARHVDASHHESALTRSLLALQPAAYARAVATVDIAELALEIGFLAGHYAVADDEGEG